jgi:hypothetical protein
MDTINLRPDIAKAQCLRGQTNSATAVPGLRDDLVEDFSGDARRPHRIDEERIPRLINEHGHDLPVEKHADVATEDASNFEAGPQSAPSSQESAAPDFVDQQIMSYSSGIPAPKGFRFLAPAVLSWTMEPFLCHSRHRDWMQNHPLPPHPPPRPANGGADDPGIMFQNPRRGARTGRKSSNYPAARQSE